MDLKEAQKINEVVSGWVFRCHTGEDPGTPPNFDLAEALEATKIVEAANGARDEQGRRTFQLVCDPRILAALYVLANYEAGLQSNPTVILAGGCKALCLVRVPEGTAA